MHLQTPIKSRPRIAIQSAEPTMSDSVGERAARIVARADAKKARDEAAKASKPFLHLWDSQFYENRSADLYGQSLAYVQKHGLEFGLRILAIWKDVNMMNFMTSGTGNEELGDDWTPIRVLGFGGGGRVGLWQKLDERTGDPIDSIAIKEAEYRPFDTVPTANRTVRLPKEAFVMEQLQAREGGWNGWKNGRNILMLKALKVYPNSERARCRLYLEYAPYGSLTPLFFTYRAWKTYLPEPFLWHLFHNLANAINVMANGFFLEPGTQKRAPNDMGFVHFDIKLDNIFLGEPFPSSAMNTYPAIKLADFGLAKLTGDGDQQNPSAWYRLGTEDYKPPVSF